MLKGFFKDAETQRGTDPDKIIADGVGIHAAVLNNNNKEAERETLFVHNISIEPGKKWIKIAEKKLDIDRIPTTLLRYGSRCSEFNFYPNMPLNWLSKLGINEHKC